MEAKVVDLPAVKDLRGLFLAKCAAVDSLALVTANKDALAALKSCGQGLTLHWAHSQRMLSGEAAKAMAVFSVLLLTEVEEVLRRSALGGPRGAGLLDEHRFGFLVVSECATLITRLGNLRREWTWDAAVCRWAQHQWRLSELSV